MPPRRPASPVVIVVLAAVGALLAGVAGVGSYLGVAQYLQDRPAANNGAPSPDPSDSTSPGVDPSTPPPSCPPETIAAVRGQGRPGELVILLYVRGVRQNNPSRGLQGEAWICRDSDDALYYQGHDINGNRPGSNNTILVPNVTVDGRTYVAGSRRISCANQEFRSVGGSVWSVDVCLEGEEVAQAPTTMTINPT